MHVLRHHFNGNPTIIRLEVAKLGLYPEQFKNDPEWVVRREATKHIG